MNVYAATMPNIKRLFIDFTPIEKIALVDFKNLQIFSANYTELEEIEPHNGIREIYIGGTNISELNLDKENKLTILRITESKIRELDAENMTQLSCIFLSEYQELYGIGDRTV